MNFRSVTLSLLLSFTLATVFAVLLPHPTYALTWSQINTSGFGDANNSGVDKMAVYDNKLYVGTSNSTTGAEVWEYDGSTWAQVNTDGFGDSNNIESPVLISFNSRLYAGTINDVTGAEVWEYDGSTWAQVNVDGFGDSSNQQVLSLAVYAWNLYAGTPNVSGAKIWVAALPNSDPNPPSSLGGHVSGSYTASRTPTLTFTLSDPDTTSIVKFRIQIDNNSDFSSPAVDFTSDLAAQGERSFTVSPALSDGSYHWRVKAIDQNGAESTYTVANSGSIAFHVDTVPPSTPALTNIGGLGFHPALTNWYYTSTKPTFKGVGNPGSTIIISINSDPLVGSTTVGADGKWSYSFPQSVPTGEHTISIYAEDSSGNKSTSLSFNLTIDPTGAIFPQSIRDLIFGSPVEAEEEEITPPTEMEEETEVPEQEPAIEPTIETPEETRPVEKNISPWLLGLSAAALLAIVLFFSRER